MTLLDRFRAQPRQKHADPAVRLEFVAEVPLGEQDVIGSIAREDDDARVRRAAVAKLMDPPTLGIVARSDGDEGVRSQALAMLRDIALEAFEGVSESDSLEAIDELGDGKLLAQIARGAEREIVALRALSRVADARALGSIARHGVSESARFGAFTSLRDRGEHAEILAVAMNGEHKDTAVAAVDLLTARDELESVAVSSRNKNAVKRARVLMRAADERAPQEAAADQGTQTGAVEVVAAELMTVYEPGIPPVSSIEPSAEATSSDASMSVVEAIDSATPPAPLDAQSDGEPTEDARLTLERSLARLAELGELAEAAAADPDLQSARRRFGILRREWRDVSSTLSVVPDVAARFEAASSVLEGRLAEMREADTQARREGLAHLHELLARIEPLAADEQLPLKTAERAQRDVRAALAAMPPLPSREDFDEVMRRLKGALASLVPKVQALREADAWQRWANVAVQEQLCAKMEALRSVEDAEAAAREVRALQQQWREVAAVPRAQADVLWRRFKIAHDEVWSRLETQFAAEAAGRSENLVKKTALCEQAEALGDSTAWIQTADTIKRLQAEWKTIGPVPRGRERAVWDRFRVACDRFFTRRHDDLVERKKSWTENLAKKEALCVRAEALGSSTDWDRAAAELKQLQAEWKAIGPVKKTRSEAVWARFRAACDAFFSRYADRHSAAQEERAAKREAICAELEGLAPQSTPAEPPEGLVNQVRGLRTRWQQAVAARGVAPDRARALDARFEAALARLLAEWPAAFSGTELDPDTNRKRMESLVKRVEELATSVQGPTTLPAPGDAGSSSTRLAAMLKEALAANTIGGKADDGSRLRAVAEELGQARALWSRLGPVPDASRRPLVERFDRACRRIADKVGGAGSGRY